jgi:hypothetical protein
MHALKLLLGASAAVAVLVAGATSLRAAPGDSGTIYYRAGDSLWRMNPDGTGKAVVPIQNPGNVLEPSTTLHGGRRWFLQMESAPAAGGRRLLALPDDGGAAVTLVFDAAVAVGNDFEWTRDDATVLYDAVDFADPSAPVGRVYRLAVSFDAAGAPSAAGTPIPVLTTGTRTTGSIVESLIYGLTWSPTADRIAFGELKANLSAYEVHVMTLATGARSKIGDGNFPSWHPDGTKILFSKSSSLVTVSPSGTNLKTILKADSWSSFLAPLDWSPDGSALVFTKHGRRWPMTKDVWTVLATGKSSKDLTADVAEHAFPIGWR